MALCSMAISLAGVPGPLVAWDHEVKSQKTGMVEQGLVVSWDKLAEAIADEIQY